MTPRLPVLSFRSRILLLVLGVALVPLALTGFWLTGSTARSGEALLRTRLGEQLDEDLRTVGIRWIPYRSALLDVAEHPALVELLEAGGGVADPGLEGIVAALPPEVVSLRVAAPDGRTVWRRDRFPVSSPLAFGTPLRTEVEIRSRLSGELLGALEASLPLQALLRETAGAAPGVVVAALDRPEGTLLTPTAFDPLLLEEPRFRWGEDEWITASAEVREPRLRLVAAAPLSPFVGPFGDAARRGGLLLFVTAGLGLGAAVLLTGRMTRSLEELAAAAESVAAGEMEAAVAEGGEDEIGRVSRAFNAMTRSLRRTLARLADREALAAVGEFAATLAHEIRNPLTAIQLDMQQVEERLRPGSRERELQRKALDHVRRLDRTVAGALETARSGRRGRSARSARNGAAGTEGAEPGVPIGEPLLRAVATARALFGKGGASLEVPAEESRDRPPVRVEGDSGALERAFLNVLLNAGQAAGRGGAVRVRVGIEGDGAVIAVEDDGPGVPPGIADRVFDPLVTGREGGTGLGLPVTRRIVEAHGGTVTLESRRSGRGTTVWIRLPLAEPRPAGVGGGPASPTPGSGEGSVTDRSARPDPAVTDRSGGGESAPGVDPA